MSKLKFHYVNRGTNVELNVIQKLLSSLNAIFMFNEIT